MLDSGHWAVTLVEHKNSRGEVLMAFNGGWGWKDRKYVLSGNNGSGTLELQVRVKNTPDHISSAESRPDTAATDSILRERNCG
jgi:hypothetical protein